MRIRYFFWSWVLIIVQIIAYGIICYKAVTDAHLFTPIEDHPLATITEVELTENHYTILMTWSGNIFTANSDLTDTAPEVGQFIELPQNIITSYTNTRNLLIGVLIFFAVIITIVASDVVLRIKLIFTKKQGKRLTAIITGYTHIAPFTWTINVETTDGVVYRYRRYMLKRECTKFPVGTTVDVYNNGKRDTWVNL